MKVKVIASEPDDIQDSISHLIGNIYKVEEVVRDNNGKLTGQVRVHCSDFEGPIFLNRSEYEILDK